MNCCSELLVALAAAGAPQLLIHCANNNAQELIRGRASCRTSSAALSLAGRCADHSALPKMTAAASSGPRVRLVLTFIVIMVAKDELTVQHTRKQPPPAPAEREQCTSSPQAVRTPEDESSSQRLPGTCMTCSRLVTFVLHWLCHWQLSPQISFWSFCFCCHLASTDQTCSLALCSNTKMYQ